MFEFLREHQLNIMLVLCGVCGMLAALLLMTRFLSKSRKWIMALMEATAFFLLWFDRTAYIYAGDPTYTGYIMVRLSNFFVFFLTSMVVFAFDLYLVDYLGHEGELKLVPYRLRFAGVMSLIGMLMAIVSAFTDFYYYFDQMNYYHRGSGFLFAYIIPVVCPLVQLSVILQYYKRFSKLILTSLLLYIIVPIACGILQIFTYGISIVNMAMVAVSISMYIFTYMDINNTVERAHQIEIQNMKGERFKMQRLFDQTASAFVSAVEKKDDFSIGNANLVADYAKRIAEHAGKSPEECENVYYAALLHDVGMIGIPDAVIKNEEDPGKWDREVMHTKPIIGNEILSQISEYPYLAEGAHYSHERYDGSGYPEGLKGEKIPEIARIIGVADAYVTMTTKKRYREAKPDFVAREALIRGSGIEFDPTFAEYMVKIIDEDSGKKANDTSNEIETELTSERYRENVSCGIPVEFFELKVSFEFTPLDDANKEFAAPSVILFDSYDRRVHGNERSIEAYKYFEYGELWFDTHSISTGARRMKEIVRQLTPEDGEIAENAYEIVMGRYEDHLKLIMRSSQMIKEVIVALPSVSKSTYLGLTAEAGTLTNITVEETGNEIGENDIPRIADEISYIDRIESDIKNVQVNRPRSAYTEGVELKDRRRVMFHTMSLPGAGFVWHCPYIVLYYSDNGLVDGPNYKEYALVKLYGENEGEYKYSENSISVKRTDEFSGWENWKNVNKEGMECEVSFKKKAERIILKTKNLGIDLENVTTLQDASSKVYIALTGDQVALTDIRVR